MVCVHFELVRRRVARPRPQINIHVHTNTYKPTRHTAYRMWIARRKRRHTVLQRVAAATTLAMWYGGLFKRRRAVKSAAAVKIQSVWRMYQVKVALELGE